VASAAHTPSVPRARRWPALFAVLLWGVLGVLVGVRAPGTVVPGLAGAQAVVGAVDRRSAASRPDTGADPLREPHHGPAIAPPSASHPPDAVARAVPEPPARGHAPSRRDANRPRARGPPSA